jgi:hypothetical protein
MNDADVKIGMHVRHRTHGNCVVVGNDGSKSAQWMLNVLDDDSFTLFGSSHNMEPIAKQIGTRYRARKDPDHNGLWVIVDRNRILEWIRADLHLGSGTWYFSSIKYLDETVHFPSIQTALDFVKLLELSDQTNRSIK